MNLVFVNKHFINDNGGSEIQTHIISKKFAKDDNNVSYINLSNQTKKKLTKLDYKVFNIGKNFYKLFHLIYKLNPDIIYWRLNTNFSLIGLVIAKFLKIPIIFASSSLKDLDSKNFYSNFLIYFDHITVNNKKFLKYIKSKNKTYVQNSLILGNEKFSYKKKYVLWVSNIKKRKNLELYIKLSNKYLNYNVHFLCVGAIQDENYLWIKNLNKLPKNFKYLGKMSPQKINTIMKKSLFHITTENYDKVGFSNTFLQACSQKKPTLSFNFDPGGLISKYKTGKYCKGSEKIFFKHFENYYNNVNIRKKHGMNAYVLAKKEFSENNCINKLMKIFKKLK